MFGKKWRIIASLEEEIRKLKLENNHLKDQLAKKKRLFNPDWHKEITVSPYVFDKYIRHVGHPVIGGYHVYESNRYFEVVVDKEMRDGYIRYEVPFEIPHAECKKCETTYEIGLGHDEHFCSPDCYENFINKKSLV